MTAKDKITYTMAVLAFVIGFGLTIAGFCVPPTGEISGGVLWVLGQSLVFCASVFGIAMHYDAQLADFKAEIRHSINSNETK